MTGLSACIPWQTDPRVGMSDEKISKPLDHRIGIEAIFGTLGETVAFSALSPPRHDWFAKLVYLADQPCMCVHSNRVTRGYGTCSPDYLLLLT